MATITVTRDAYTSDTSKWKTVPEGTTPSGEEVKFNIRYKATRDNQNPNYVTLNLEPQVYYANKLIEGNANSKVSMFYFNKANFYKGVTNDTTYTNCCALPGGYHSDNPEGKTNYVKHEAGNWYGGTGTTVFNSGYWPYDSDTWVCGNWTNIKVPLDRMTSELSLVFYYTGDYVFGFFSESVNTSNTAWQKAKAESITVKLTDIPTLPDITAPTEIKLNDESNSNKEIFTNDEAHLTWKMSEITINPVISYDVSMFYNIDGTDPEQWRGPVHLARVTTTSCNITRSAVEDVLNSAALTGENANAYYTNANATTGWSKVKFRVTANPTYGNLTYSSESPILRFNELPSIPILDYSEAISINEVDSAQISAVSMDYFYPRTSKAQESKPDGYIINYKGINQSEAITDTNSTGIFSITKQSGYYEPGNSGHTFEICAYDSLGNSSSATGSYALGKELSVTLEKPDDNSTINDSMRIKVTSVTLDGTSVPPYNTTLNYVLQANDSENEMAWKTIDSTSLTSATSVTGIVTFENIFTKLKQAGYSFGAKQSYKFRVIVYSSKRAGLTKTVDAGTYTAAAASLGVPQFNLIDNTLKYALGRYTPVVTTSDKIKITAAISGSIDSNWRYSINYKKATDNTASWTSLYSAAINGDIDYTLYLNRADLQEVLNAGMSVQVSITNGTNTISSIAQWTESKDETIRLHDNNAFMTVTQTTTPTFSLINDNTNNLVSGTLSYQTTMQKAHRIYQLVTSKTGSTDSHKYDVNTNIRYETNLTNNNKWECNYRFINGRSSSDNKVEVALSGLTMKYGLPTDLVSITVPGMSEKLDVNDTGSYSIYFTYQEVFSNTPGWQETTEKLTYYYSNTYSTSPITFNYNTKSAVKAPTDGSVSRKERGAK